MIIISFTKYLLWSKLNAKNIFFLNAFVVPIWKLIKADFLKVWGYIVEVYGLLSQTAGLRLYCIWARGSLEPLS